MGKVNQWLQDLDPRGSPHLEEDLIGGECRSRSPLPNPSKRCKKRWRERGESKLKRVNNGGKFRGLWTLETLGKKPPFIGKPEYGRWRQNWALRFYFGPTDPATNHIGPQLGRPTVEPELFWKSKQAGRYTDRLNFGLYQDDRSTDRSTGIQPIWQIETRKTRYLLHPESDFYELGLVLKLTTSSRTSCRETPRISKRENIKSGEVWNLAKWVTDKTFELENAIGDACELRFRWAWTCCKASNKLKNLSWRTTKKYQEIKYQDREGVKPP
jgi:hypothetical protein